MTLWAHPKSERKRWVQQKRILSTNCSVFTFTRTGVTKIEEKIMAQFRWEIEDSRFYLYFLFIHTQWWRELVAVYNTKYTDWFCLQLIFPVSLSLSLFRSLHAYLLFMCWGSQDPKNIAYLAHCGYTINVNDMKTGQIDSYRFVSGVILSNQEVDANKSPRIIIEYKSEENSHPNVNACTYRFSAHKKEFGEFAERLHTIFMVW